MKKITFIAITLLAALFVGCNRNAPETFHGNVARPDWTAPEHNDMTASMTAVIQVDLKKQYPDIASDFVISDDDLLAAFAGEQCLGVTGPNENLFFLYINQPAQSSLITLRYWSAQYRNLFEAPEEFTFTNDKHFGTMAEPLVPYFKVVK